MESLHNFWTDSKSLIIFCILVGLTILTAVFVRKYLQKKITEKAKEQNIDITSFIFLEHLIVAIIYFVGFGWALLLLPITNTFAHSLFAGAGATTLVLGFASQQLFTNLLSGVVLVIRKPFKIADVIEFQGSTGTVVEINLNSTLIQDGNGDKIIIPSSLMLSDKIKILKKDNLSQQVSA